MARQPLSQSPLIVVSVAPDAERVERGEEAIFQITIENRGNAAAPQSMELRGLPADWYKLDFDARKLAFPGEQRKATLVVSPPRDAVEGQHQFQVAVSSGPAETAVACSLEVLAPSLAPDVAVPAAPVVRPPEVSLAPALSVWRGESQGEERVTLRVRNGGGEECEYTVALDGLDAGWYTLSSRLRVAAGQALETDIRLHPPARARQGDYPFSVAIAVDGYPNVGAEASGWLSLPASSPAPAAEVAAPVPRPEVSASPPRPPAPMEVGLAPRSTFRFGPDELSSLAIVTIQNKSTLVERYTVSVEGLPPEWYGLSVSEVRAEPGASAQVPLRLAPRTGPGWPAGDYEFRVKVIPQSTPEASAEVGGLISITGVAGFDARLAPVQAEGRRATFSLTLMNTGDLPLGLALETSDPEGMCKFKFPAPRDLDPGQQAIVPVKVSARRNGIIGPPETFDVKISAKLAEEPSTNVKTLDARFIHHPRFTYRGLFLVGFVCFVLALVAAIVSFASPSVAGAATWVGCQLDRNYRFAANAPSLKKEECGGKPRSEEFDKWQEQPKSSLPTSGGATGVAGIPPGPLGETVHGLMWKMNQRRPPGAPS